MLKRADSPYRSGRRRGDWWKWKIDPLTIDAVLIYAQAGHGRRSTLYTDYTFGLWHEGALVPVAKAYSGLDDREILDLDRWIRAHTTERFGPVRAVTSEHVFELGFEAVNASKRQQVRDCGALPRILRWRHDKRPQDADTLAAVAGAGAMRAAAISAAEAARRWRGWFAQRGWRPSPFQREVWRRYLAGESGLLHTPTGSGKTLAALGGRCWKRCASR